MIVNLQRKIDLDAKRFRAIVEAMLEKVVEANGKEFSIAFVSDRRMKELNRFFRGKNSTTDVLSFTHEPEPFESASDNEVSNYLGDVVISAEQAERQAKENGLPLEGEINQLILHGLLHLCGYDHETDDGEMNKRELELRRKLKI